MQVIFIILSFLSTLLVILTQNPVISVFNLILLYIIVALYLMYLGISYIGISYIIIYIGAIAILFLFIIMMIDVEITYKKYSNFLPLLSILFITLIVSIIFATTLNWVQNYIIFTWDWNSSIIKLTQVSTLGDIFYSNYHAFIYILSFILLLAMVGAIILTKIKSNNNHVTYIHFSAFPYTTPEMLISSESGLLNFIIFLYSFYFLWLFYYVINKLIINRFIIFSYIHALAVIPITPSDKPKKKIVRFRNLENQKIEEKAEEEILKKLEIPEPPNYIVRTGDYNPGAWYAFPPEYFENIAKANDFPAPIARTWMSDHVYSKVNPVRFASHHNDHDIRICNEHYEAMKKERDFVRKYYDHVFPEHPCWSGKAYDVHKQMRLTSTNDLVKSGEKNLESLTAFRDMYEVAIETASRKINESATYPAPLTPLPSRPILTSYITSFDKGRIERDVIKEYRALELIGPKYRSPHRRTTENKMSELIMMKLKLQGKIFTFPNENYHGDNKIMPIDDSNDYTTSNDKGKITELGLDNTAIGSSNNKSLTHINLVPPNLGKELCSHYYYPYPGTEMWDMDRCIPNEHDLFEAKGKSRIVDLKKAYLKYHDTKFEQLTFSQKLQEWLDNQPPNLYIGDFIVNDQTNAPEADINVKKLKKGIDFSNLSKDSYLVRDEKILAFINKINPDEITDISDDEDDIVIPKPKRIRPDLTNNFNTTFSYTEYIDNLNKRAPNFPHTNGSVSVKSFSNSKLAKLSINILNANNNDNDNNVNSADNNGSVINTVINSNNNSNNGSVINAVININNNSNVNSAVNSNVNSNVKSVVNSDIKNTINNNNNISTVHNNENNNNFNIESFNIDEMLIMINPLYISIHNVITNIYINVKEFLILIKDNFSLDFNNFNNYYGNLTYNNDFNWDVGNNLFKYFAAFSIATFILSLLIAIVMSLYYLVYFSISLIYICFIGFTLKTMIATIILVYFSFFYTAVYYRMYETYQWEDTKFNNIIDFNINQIKTKTINYNVNNKLLFERMKKNISHVKKKKGNENITMLALLIPIPLDTPWYNFEVYFYVILLLAIILWVVNLLFSLRILDMDKGRGFECGLQSFFQTREQFHISFHRVSLLFLAFDLEIVVIYPAGVSDINPPLFYNLLIFILILMVGFIYEISVNALDIFITELLDNWNTNELN
jgi:NADH-ubiquinone oxidoreductase chain 6